MNQGKYVFSQVMEFIPRYQFDKLVKLYKGDWRAKNLNSNHHLLHLHFGQLTGCDSLRDICLCLKAHSKILYHLGFRKAVNHKSLSHANENRDYHIFEGMGFYLIDVVMPMYHFGCSKIAKLMILSTSQFFATTWRGSQGRGL